MLTALAWLLATAPEGDLHAPDEALRLARRAYERVGGRSAEVLLALAEAHARRGDFEEAIRWIDAARARAREEGGGILLQQIESAQRRYRAKHQSPAVRPAQADSKS